jgi:ribosome biogenesis GTPase / thiamine phosphate phosphatase
VQAWESNATPLIVLTKSDLIADLEAEVAAFVEAAPTTECVAVSSVHGHGIDQLRARLVDRTAVMLGESGAGKSTLANALVGSDVAETGHVRSTDAKGRHTTTHRELFPLPSGGVLIDTPGIRALGLWASSDAIDHAFTDITDLEHACRFRDCSHDSEPGCAVIAAVEANELSRSRLDSWRELRREAASTELRADNYARRKAEREMGRDFAKILKSKGKR